MSVFKATASLIFVQVFSRFSTFAINQASLRYLSPALLGASTQLELYSTTILTFARDSIRVALARQGYDPNLQNLMNTAHLPLVLGMPLALVFKFLYEKSGLPDVVGMAQAVNWVAIASIIELLAEPAFALVQVKGEYGVRASAETTATVARCVFTFVVVVYADANDQDAGVMPFAYGQMAYAVTLLLVYLWRVGPMLEASKVKWFPKRVAVSTKNSKDEYLFGLVSRTLLWLAFTLSAQTIVKQLLGEGDHVVMAMFASLEDQGTYDLAHNYGSLIARMGLQPIEEGCRGLFGRLCAAKEEQEICGEKEVVDSKRQSSIGNDNTQQALSTLGVILRLYNLFALVCCALGPSVAPLLLRVIAGAKWSNSSPSSDTSSSAGSVLSMYCYLIPLMAFNGIFEAFVSAVATPAQLYQQSVAMGVFTACFGGVSFVFLGYLRWGAEGLVLAQCVAMGLRIIWSWHFTGNWFKNRGLALKYQKFLPNPMSIAVSAVAAASIRREMRITAVDVGIKGVSETLQIQVDEALLRQLIIKGGVSVLTAICLFITERDFWLEQYQTFQSSKANQRKTTKTQ